MARKNKSYKFDGRKYSSRSGRDEVRIYLETGNRRIKLAIYYRKTGTWIEYNGGVPEEVKTFFENEYAA